MRRGAAVKNRHEAQWDWLQAPFDDALCQGHGQGRRRRPAPHVAFCARRDAQYHAAQPRVLESDNVPLTWDIDRLIMCYMGKKANPAEISSYRPLGVSAMIGKLDTIQLLRLL